MSGQEGVPDARKGTAMTGFRLTVDIYDDPKGDGSVLGDFRGTDDSFTVKDATSEAEAVELASEAIVAEHGHAWLVKDVMPLGLEVREGEDVRFYAGKGEHLTGRLVLREDVDGDSYLNIVVREGDAFSSWVVPDDGVLAAGFGYRVGTEDEFYDHDNLLFPGTVIEVDEDGVLYVSSRKLTKNVWVDPITLRITENSVYDYA